MSLFVTPPKGAPCAISGAVGGFGGGLVSFQRRPINLSSPLAFFPIQLGRKVIPISAFYSSLIALSSLPRGKSLILSNVSGRFGFVPKHLFTLRAGDKGPGSDVESLSCHLRLKLYWLKLVLDRKMTSFHY